MNWTDAFKIVAAMYAALGSAGIIIFALSSWLGKVWANRILENEKNQHARELEYHKTELAKLKKEHEITFSKLQEKRADVIEMLYAQLVDTYDAFHSLIKPFQPVGEHSLTDKFSTFVKVYNEYYHYFQKKRIYFAPSVCKTIDELNKVLFESQLDLQIHPIEWDSPELRVQPSLIIEKRKYWSDVRDRFKSDVVNLKINLENSFRAIIGVNESNDSNNSVQSKN